MTHQERIAKHNQKFRQLEEKQRRMKQQEAAKQKKIDKSRRYYISEFAIKYFPFVLQFIPCSTKTETEKEFASLINIFKHLAADKQLLECLTQPLDPENQE